MGKYYAYMLQSEKTCRHYYGHCEDLQERLNEHNTNQSPYTKGKGPWILPGYFQGKSRSEVMAVELKLKKIKNPKRAIRWLEINGSVLEDRSSIPKKSLLSG